MNIQEKLLIFGEYGCLAMDYIWAALYDKSSTEERAIPGLMDIMTTTALLSAFDDKSLLDDECTVMNASALMEAVSGNKYTVIKKTISSFEEIPNDGNWRAIRKSYNGHSHWALWRGNNLVFNSMSRSVCYENGYFDEVREIMRVKE